MLHVDSVTFTKLIKNKAHRSNQRIPLSSKKNENGLIKTMFNNERISMIKF